MLRTAVREDFEDIIAIARRSFQDDDNKLDLSPVDLALVQAGNCLVATDRKGRIVAYATFISGFGENHNNLYLYEIGTHPSARRQGHAARLLSSIHRYYFPRTRHFDNGHLLSLVSSGIKFPGNRPFTCRLARALDERELRTLWSLCSRFDPELRYAIHAFMIYGRLMIIEQGNSIVAACGLFGDLRGEKIFRGFFLPYPFTHDVFESATLYPDHDLGAGSMAKKPIFVTTNPANTAMLRLLFNLGFRGKQYALCYPLLGSRGRRFVLTHEDVGKISKSSSPSVEGIAGDAGEKQIRRDRLDQVDAWLRKGWEMVGLTDGDRYFRLRPENR